MRCPFSGTGLFIEGWRELCRALQAGRLASDRLCGLVGHLQYTGHFAGLFGAGVGHWPTVFSVTLFPIIVLGCVLFAYRKERDRMGKFRDRYEQYRRRVPIILSRDAAVGARSSEEARSSPACRIEHHSSEETQVKSRLSVALPGVALALLVIAAAHAAPPPPRAPAARATEPASMSAKHLSAMEARMKLMQGQMRRICETKSPEVRAKLLREHMRTMMEQMRAMSVMGGPMMSRMMHRGMMGGISMGHGKMGSGDRHASSAKQHPRGENGMRDDLQDRLDMMRMMMEQSHMQDRLDMMQMMMGQMMGQMQAMQGMTMKGKGPHR